MRWFKHETDAIHSEKLSKLVDQFGFEGYGRYWRIMELIAERMNESEKCSLELPEKDWLRYLVVRRPLFRRYLVVIGQLFDIHVITTGLLLRIEIPNLLEKRDNYTTDLQAKRKKLPNRSRSRKEVDYKKTSQGELLTPVKKYKFEQWDMNLAKRIFEHCKDLVPSTKEPNWENWANEVRLMREEDKRGKDNIWEIACWMAKDKFWAAQIRSPHKLRKHYETLYAKRNG